MKDYYITTASRTRKRVKQQISVNVTCGNIQCELPVLVVNKLIHHCMLGMDALNRTKAVINISGQTMTYTLNNIPQNIKFTITEED